MKTDIHPKYFPNAQVICACGNTWTTGSTREVIHTDMCSNCHPFYTGEQRIVDTEGQVDRFYKKLEARNQFIAAAEAREAAKEEVDQALANLELSDRVAGLLAGAGYSLVSQVVAALAADEGQLLAIDGFGQKALIELKRRLRQGGHLPEEETPEAA